MPEELAMPVVGASSNDWSDQTFWYEPWGSSGVHKGIDIFGQQNTSVIAATGGLVLYSGELSKGGNVVAILGPKWRLHYYAHLQARTVTTGRWVWGSSQIGTLGSSGNAAGKPPHLHYSILSVIPLPWKSTTDTQGWKRMFYLDPGEKLT
ncbi:M23 family metallopeptidase [Oceanicoccus sp.]|uniref:M23 family metallopeptidase n=1 Tax=Oceanicoccus sp. TaxID=2691044 RepID=UPI0026395CA6|nr:M23 family metallopeptidase [Oceanicoccus sp.]